MPDPAPTPADVPPFPLAALVVIVGLFNVSAFLIAVWWPSEWGVGIACWTLGYCSAVLALVLERLWTNVRRSRRDAREAQR